jgi:ferrous iron transport protein B
MDLANQGAKADARTNHGVRIKKLSGEKVVALGGNPNVGKSTVFNSLTGLHQHTGNWPGKTVVNAQGRCRFAGQDYIMVDIPGTYSLMANSAEEETARDFICFGDPDVTVIVADATCLERNLNLVLQVMEITDRVVLCVNLMDEAKKKRIRIDLTTLSATLGIPVVGTSARSRKGLQGLMEAVGRVARLEQAFQPLSIRYGDAIEQAVALLEPAVMRVMQGRLNSRWVTLRLLDGDVGLISSIRTFLGYDITEDAGIAAQRDTAFEFLSGQGITTEALRDQMVTQIVKACETIAREAVAADDERYFHRDIRFDRILTAKRTGIPIMILMLLGIFWITIEGANVPSSMIADGLLRLMDPLHRLFEQVSAPDWLSDILIDGAFKTLAWVVSVMLPPMAIFFPLFTLLEDLGYLPRVAFNLDNHFRKACAHGKQALTMCMGFGCNACGVIGCRIIDSPRERLIAILTNNFVPCNGRFPTLIAIITMFFAGALSGALGSIVSTLLLTGVIVLGVAATFLLSKLLSRTILKGVPSSFQLELPPYRRPQIGKVIVHSMLDRTLFVLGRAVVVAAPAGVIIWLLANMQIGGVSVLAACAGFLDPFARLMGLDGYILMAFILGFPANEIVIPILIMSYMATGSILELDSLNELRALFISHGWTWVTAVCMMLFSLMHWPCGTTLLTIHRETREARWTAAAFLIPTVTGVAACMIVAGAARLFGLL